VRRSFVLVDATAVFVGEFGDLLVFLRGSRTRAEDAVNTELWESIEGVCRDQRCCLGRLSW
jgi:hypothetical protein